jgi:copper(I)-binding protein
MNRKAFSMKHQLCAGMVCAGVGLLAAAALPGLAYADPPMAMPMATPMAMPMAMPMVGAVTVRQAWARATPPGATTGIIYLTLTSPAADRLTGVATPVAASARLHVSVMSGGVMQMRPLPEGLALPAGRTVTLAPMGTHIMLDGLKAPLTQGESFPLHLTFAHAAPVDVTATVQPIGASGPGDGMDGMNMGGSGQ